MIKRLSTLILLCFFCSFSWANKECKIILDKSRNTTQSVEFEYGIVSFRLVESARNYRVLVSLENTTTSDAFLLFRNGENDKGLRKYKPRIEFVKTYPGSKGNRKVSGCKDIRRLAFPVIPQETNELFAIEVKTASVTRLEIPVYLAVYNTRQMLKRGKESTNYKIWKECILVFNIELKAWSEDDPEYVEIKAAVENYVGSVSVARFCNNKRHNPSLAEQQRPYQEKKDSLVNVIRSVFNRHSDWMSDQAPYIAYSSLFSQLNAVNLNEHNFDCGNHTPKPAGHGCTYCALSIQQVYHQFDDLYQRLRGGKIDKEAAVKKAKGLYNCYQHNSKRKKDASYGDKISRFYSRITSY